MLSLLFLSHKYLLNLYNGDLQTTTVLFTRNFTQGWLNYYYWLLSVLFCPFIVQHNQYNERSWNRTFVFLCSQELHCDLIFDHNVCSYCVRLVCAFVIYLCHTHINVVVGLLIISSMNTCVSVAFVLSFLMLNDIRSFLFA